MCLYFHISFQLLFWWEKKSFKKSFKKIHPYPETCIKKQGPKTSTWSTGASENHWPESRGRKTTSLHASAHAEKCLEKRKQMAIDCCLLLIAAFFFEQRWPRRGVCFVYMFGCVLFWASLYCLWSMVGWKHQTPIPSLFVFGYLRVFVVNDMNDLEPWSTYYKNEGNDTCSLETCWLYNVCPPQKRSLTWNLKISPWNWSFHHFQVPCMSNLGGCTKKHPKGCGPLTANWRLFMRFSSLLRNIPQKTSLKPTVRTWKFVVSSWNTTLSETGMTYFFSVRTC